MMVISVIGARPQFVKAAVVSRALREAGIDELLVHTGQHYDNNMSGVFFSQLSIPEPAENLGIGSMSHGAQTGRMLEALEAVFLSRRPDFVMVYGDTNSTLAGAVAAAKLHIPVAHVEAGLRSYNRAMPEEINRVVTDHLSDLLFVPTDVAVENLLKEGIGEAKIRIVGDVMYDAALEYGRVAFSSSRILEALGVRRRQFVLCTVHRAENTDDPERLKRIIDGLRSVSGRMSVVLPLHPRTRSRLPANLQDRRFIVTEPVSYLDMLALEQSAAVIATDSGGVQKEAFFFRVPCVTIRTETEWVELIRSGWNTLVNPADPDGIREAILRAANSPPPPVPAADLYGGGSAARRIAGILRDSA
jgi:UDP-GlcNAc3NAcA epimerase